MTDASNLPASAKASLGTLFTDVPDDYSQALRRLMAIDEAVRDRIASQLEPRLNRELKSKMAELKSHKERRQIVPAIDGMLVRLGLCMSYDDKPALLSIERDGDSGSEASQYSILVSADNRQGFTRTPATADVPDVQLMALPQNSDQALTALRNHAYAYARQR